MYKSLFSAAAHTAAILYEKKQDLNKFIVLVFNKSKVFVTLADYCSYLVLHNYKVGGL